MLISDRYHLTYCTNIHPGENWQLTFDSLATNLPKIKERVAPSADFGLGLRLSNKVSEELGLGKKLADFKNWLESHNSYVFTMNGFPFGNFHGTRVKEKVHEPDWTTTERVTYTKRLFQQLLYLVPEEIPGGVSTSPVGYKYRYNGDEQRQKALTKGAENMVEIALHLHQIEKETGRYLHLDIEPEPDGLLENSTEVLHFFQDFLVPIGIKVFHDHCGMAASEAEQAIKRYLTICYDICHFSLAYEEPQYTFEKFAKSGIRIGKIQVSAALKIRADENNRDLIWDQLKQFDEPTYLHQVTEKVSEKVKTYTDLPEVLAKKQPFKELRAHFHVPIFLERFAVLESTQDHIVKVVDYLRSHTVSDHLEVETYTWDVLPETLKVPIHESVARELNWLKKRL